ncbi:MAG: hypothetical protein LBC86_06840 [Oscillospiraceae bacterium]|jgi:hypothetical protein|nr:hypothetical protein [Oscillospiraceae bacterium]
MTRKQALHKALEVLTDSEVIAKINEIADELPLTGWSRTKIFDTIDQFVLDNGRNPTATDFLPKGMPPHPVIKLRFGMTLGEFLAEHYPQPTPDREEYKQLFISEYERIQPRGACDFNNRRTDGLPAWGTFAKMFGFSRWLEWVCYCGLERSSPVLKARERGCGLSVTGYVDLK